MGAVEHSSDTVEEQLSVLKEVYDSFSVNQTTVSVAPSQYERVAAVAERGDIEVYAAVRNDDGDVLHAGDGDESELPSGTASAVDELERAARAAVREAADIEWTLAGVDRAHIRGVRDADDESRDTVYSLAVVVEGRAESTDDQLVWESSAEPQLVGA
jgi:hypothetical protein